MKSALTLAALVGAGGFIGALARFAMAGLFQRLFPLSVYPWGTLFVNLLGCLLIGVIAGFAEKGAVFSPEFRTFVLIGLLGGFTTYSTFGYETFVLLRQAEFFHAAANVLVHLVAGVLMVWLGFVLATAR